MEKQYCQIDSVVTTLNLALELCGDKSRTAKGAVTSAIDSVRTLQWMMLERDAGLKGNEPPVDEDAEDDDYSWMDDMEAAGAAPL